jgi:hypothetical protein
LILWARHAAWLNAIPHDKNKPITERKDTRTRLERLEASGSQQVNMPELELAGYIAELAVEIGFARSTPLDWSELKAYSEMTGIYLTPWESKVIRQMSLAYVGQAAVSSDQECLPPYFGVNGKIDIEQRRKSVDDALRKALKPRGKKK